MTDEKAPEDHFPPVSFQVTGRAFQQPDGSWKSAPPVGVPEPPQS